MNVITLASTVGPVLELEGSKASLGFPKLVLQGQNVGPRGGDVNMETPGMPGEFATRFSVPTEGQLRRVACRRGLGFLEAVLDISL